ncbi:hypothetical protein [Laspinema olomoucense]|uniref:PEP-CTERM protein-sorting domain-containing protein n=1 Tax=Laspinema olomoucense D3b TaxID=2953688 RepID=A0ABT2NI17_9CYAN|nr:MULTISPECIES: hypothetical protein [unclassified Laspinema]MCT7980990.1 hypothetical protein [Laspinema sp. D3b]MCT7991563.1 hypothetical protein [Laspinema sp. D3a]
MTLNLLTRSTLAITGAVFSLGTVAINSANAARITYKFDVSATYYEQIDSIINGQFSRTYKTIGNETFSGWFGYDEATEEKSGYTLDDINQSPWGFLTYDNYRYQVDTMEFLFRDRVYTLADSFYPVYWRNDYIDGEKFGDVLEGWETEDFGFETGSYRVEAIWNEFYDKTTPISNYGSVDFSLLEVTPTSVPEPSMLGALSVVSLAGLLRKTRIKAGE